MKNIKKHKKQNKIKNEVKTLKMKDDLQAQVMNLNSPMSMGHNNSLNHSSNFSPPPNCKK